MSRFAAARLDRASYTAFVEIPVLYGDLDTNFHVNNVSMGRFFEHARFSSVGELRGIEPGLAFVVARVTIDYVSEGRIGTPVTVGTRVSQIGSKSLTLEQAAWQGDRPVSLCETVLVRVVDGHPTDLPASVRDHLARG